MVNGVPVLIRRDNEVFPPSSYLKYIGRSRGRPSSLFSNLIPSPSINLASRANLREFAHALVGVQPAYVLVVGSGLQKTWLEKLCSAYQNIRLVYCDIDAGAIVDVFCDAHELPFEDAVFDGVITTAVLEHVLDPERAVSEMHRILAPGGVIYSEIPFMQQVHEGAYDFTRYTLSGHRRLFRYFLDIRRGAVAGPATALVWAIEHFALAFFAGPRLRQVAKALVRLAFFWIKYFDYLLFAKTQAMDGASCTYFLGRKQDRAVKDLEIIRGYRGGKVFGHA